MNLSEIFKQLKKIEPDPGFTERSRRMVLATPQEDAPALRRGISIWSVLEAGLALVLAGFFIVLVTGQFPGSSYLSPVQFSVIDPQGLRAEAQAIDMQIQLSNLNYTVPATAPHPATAPKPTTPKNVSGLAPSGASSATTSATSSATSTVSLDDALEQLSQ